MKIKVGLIGCGTVGSGTALILREKRDYFFKKYGYDLELKWICDKGSPSKVTDLGFPSDIFTDDAYKVINDPEVDVVVELIGGIEPANTFVISAINSGKHVVTANKALLATNWDTIWSAVTEKRVILGFEASVGGGIPIIKSIREALAANKIQRIIGIMNGTTNYILTKMEDEKKDFDEVLNEAQKLGYAEADPTFDIEGIDTAHKLKILSSLAFGCNVSLNEIYISGIKEINLNDINFAKELGYTIKLLAIGQLIDDQVELRVHPTLIPNTHPLAQVKGAYNAFFIEGDKVGKIMLQGLGAGKFPTASAVVADILDIARFKDNTTLYFNKSTESLELKKITEHVGRYYACFYVADKPGVLAAISGVLGRKKISIASVIQKERSKESQVPIVMLTHEAKEQDMMEAISEIDQLEFVSSKTKIIRIEDLDSWED